MPNPGKRKLRSVLALIATCASTLAVADYVDDWGPAIGSQMPAFALKDSSGVLRELENLATPSGLLLFFTRSADW